MLYPIMNDYCYEIFELLSFDIFKDYFNSNYEIIFKEKYEENIKHNKKLFSKKTKVDDFIFKKINDIDEIAKAVSNYNKLKNQICSSISDVMDLVMFNVDFILFSEKVCMMVNDEQCDLYAEKYNNGNIGLYMNGDNYKVRFFLEHTKIKNPNIAYSMLDDNKSNIDILTIEVKRDFGKKMITVYKIMSVEDFKFESFDDRAVYNLILSDLRKFTIDRLNLTLNLYIRKYNIFNDGINSNTFYKVSLEDLINNGLWIRRLTDEQRDAKLSTHS